MSFFAYLRGRSVNTLERRKPMGEQIIAIYCLRDDLLQTMHPRADAKVR
jgi:hypothetical protein